MYPAMSSSRLFVVNIVEIGIPQMLLLPSCPRLLIADAALAVSSNTRSKVRHRKAWTDRLLWLFVMFDVSARIRCLRVHFSSAAMFRFDISEVFTAARRLQFDATSWLVWCGMEELVCFDIQSRLECRVRDRAISGAALA